MPASPYTPGVSDEGSHSFIYGQGGCSFRGLPAIIVKSPYMRRLMAIRYFSDLAWILETTYEQHVTGTACYMKMFPRMVSRIRSNLFEKYLAVTYDLATGGAPPGEINGLLSTYRKVQSAYERRLSTVGPIPTLIGMLAAPPFRRPFGTHTKRLYIRALNKILWEQKFRPMLENRLNQGQDQQNNQQAQAGGQDHPIISELSEFRNNIIKFFNVIYTMGLGLRKPDEDEREDHEPAGRDGIDSSQGKGVSRTMLLAPIARIIDRAKLEKYVLSKQEKQQEQVVNSTDITKRYVENLVEAIEMYFMDLIPLDGPEGWPSLEELVNNYLQKFWLPGSFLLRYRVLGTLLGAGYVTYHLLDSLLARLESREEHVSDGLEGLLVETHDLLIQLADSMLVNFTTSLIMPHEIHILEGDQDGEVYTYQTPAGVRDLALLEPLNKALLYDNNYREVLRNIITKFFNVDNPDATINDELVASFSNATIVRLENHQELNVDCNDEEGYCTLRGPYRDQDTPSPLYILLGALVEPFYRNIGIYCCILEAQRKRRAEEPPLSGEPERSIAMTIAVGVSLVFEPPSISWWEQKVSPFLTYFEVNLVQSDMVPSSYQLDLLTRLLKDIGIGVQVGPNYLWDVVLNMDLYSVLTLDTLNTIYTFLFKDAAVSAMRASLLLKGKETNTHLREYARKLLGRNITLELSNSTVLALMYYMTLARELQKLAGNIKTLTEKLQRAPISAGSTERLEAIKATIKSIANAAERLADALESTSNIIEELTVDIILENIREDLAQLGEAHRNYIIKQARRLARDDLGEGCDWAASDRRTMIPIVGPSPTKELSPFQALRDWNTYTCLGLYNPTTDTGQEQGQLVIHGIISVPEIYLALEEKDPSLRGRLNLVGLTILSNIQSMIQETIEKLAKKLLEREGINATLVSILIPGQGVIKPYFHLPEKIANLPQIIDTLSYKQLENSIDITKCNIQPRNLIEKIEPIVEYCHHTIRYKIIENTKIYNKQIQQLTNTLNQAGPTLYVSNNTYILPDPLYWHNISFRARQEDYKKFAPAELNSKPRQSLYKTNIIYTIIIQNNRINNKKLFNIISTINKQIYELIYKIIK